MEYLKFLAKQLGHMQLSSYCLWFFSLGVQLMILLQGSFNWITSLTFVGTSLGVLCVVAINSARSVNGWLGLLSGICFIVIGFSAKNYLSIGEQLAYMVTLDLPVLISTSWNKNLASKMRHFTPEIWVVAITFTVAVYVASALIIGHLTNDPRPWFDALAFAVDLTGGLVCFLRYNNQYFWWIAGSLCQLALWVITFKQGDANAGMLVNCLIYLANDVLAFTVSPWYNKATRAKTIKQDKVLFQKN